MEKFTLQVRRKLHAQQVHCRILEHGVGKSPSWNGSGTVRPTVTTLWYRVWRWWSSGSPVWFSTLSRLDGDYPLATCLSWWSASEGKVFIQFECIIALFFRGLYRGSNLLLYFYSVLFHATLQYRYQMWDEVRTVGKKHNCNEHAFLTWDRRYIAPYGVDCLLSLLAALEWIRIQRQALHLGCCFALRCSNLLDKSIQRHYTVLYVSDIVSIHKTGLEFLGVDKTHPAGLAYLQHFKVWRGHVELLLVRMETLQRRPRQGGDQTAFPQGSCFPIPCYRRMALWQKPVFCIRLCAQSTTSCMVS